MDKQNVTQMTSAHVTENLVRRIEMEGHNFTCTVLYSLQICLMTYTQEVSRVAELSLIVKGCCGTLAIRHYTQNGGEIN
jgi:hypothetical protein